MGKARDITGLTFNYLTAVEDTGVRTYGQVWVFRCLCGKEHKAVKSEVTGGRIKSCGCAPNSGQFKGTHKDTNSPTYVSWRSMLDRCLRPTAHNYSLYGGRGITICPTWINSYECFKEDMGDRPKGHTLDRINGDLGYNLSNCRWATSLQQANNTKLNIKLTHQGNEGTLRYWEEVTGLSISILRNRYRAGWETEDILTIPKGKHRRL